MREGDAQHLGAADYDGLQVSAEQTGTTDKMYYTHSPSAIGGIISRDNNGTKLWYHFDRLGNVMAITDSNGNMYAGYTMEAFGNLLWVGTSTGYYLSQSDPQRYHLTTKEVDPETVLYYFNARWYDASTGRFASRDPVDTQGVHGLAYSYGAQNPLLNYDAAGLIPICTYRPGAKVKHNIETYDKTIESSWNCVGAFVGPMDQFVSQWLAGTIPSLPLPAPTGEAQNLINGACTCLWQEQVRKQSFTSWVEVVEGTVYCATCPPISFPLSVPVGFGVSPAAPPTNWIPGKRGTSGGTVKDSGHEGLICHGCLSPDGKSAASPGLGD